MTALWTDEHGYLRNDRYGIPRMGTRLRRALFAASGTRMTGADDRESIDLLADELDLARGVELDVSDRLLLTLREQLVAAMDSDPVDLEVAQSVSKSVAEIANESELIEIVRANQWQRKRELNVRRLADLEPELRRFVRKELQRRLMEALSRWRAAEQDRRQSTAARTVDGGP